jgi:hypothetical protein
METLTLPRLLGRAWGTGLFWLERAIGFAIGLVLIGAVINALPDPYPPTHENPERPAPPVVLQSPRHVQPPLHASRTPHVSRRSSPGRQVDNALRSRDAGLY